MQKLKQQQLFDRVFEKLPDHVTLLLIIISGFLLAQLTWMMFPSDPALMRPAAAEQELPGVSVIKAHATSSDLGKEIANMHLLGVYKPPQKVAAAAPKPVQKPRAPQAKPKKPRPPMQLVGVYAPQGKSGIAIINIKGKQQVVGVGEKIGDSEAKLIKVSAESVEILWDGAADTLSMPNIDKTASSAIQLPASQQPQAVAQQQPVLVQPASLRQGQQRVNTQPQRVQSAGGLNAGNNNQPAARATNTAGNNTQRQSTPTQNLAQQNRNGLNNNNNRPSATGNATAAGNAGSAPRLADFRQQILNNNINLLKVIRPSPKRENGKLIGFRVRPGTNRALFQQTGLQSGDVVTAINGMPLNSNAASMQAMRTLTSSTSATLTVVRGGQPTTVQVSF